MSKITLATVKSFVKKNFDKLYIKHISHFDPMTDCVEHSHKPEFKKVMPDEDRGDHRHSLGILGAWFVLSSSDYFSVFENDDYSGIEVYNCCGSFILAVKKAEA